MSDGGGRARLERIFRAALAAADPRAALEGAVSAGPDGVRLAGEALGDAGLHALAVGKAAAPMMAAVEERLGGRLRRGLVLTKDGHEEPSLRALQRAAGHPVPDARSAAAGAEALAFVGGVPSTDVLLVLLSGGASSLLTTPDVGLERRDLETATRLLLAGGAPIDELNAVRKHLSATAGGRLALAGRAARTIVLAVSDVPDDRIDLIGSGPFAPDPSRFADAAAVFRSRGLWDELPGAVRRVLLAGERGERPETPKPDDPRLAAVRHEILASNATALAAATEAAEREGFATVVEPAELVGEARAVGERWAARLAAQRPDRPTCWLAGGETTVTLRGPGRGGRCQELALAAALGLDGVAGVCLLAAGTDGTDGPTDAAGAFADGGSCARGRAQGVDARACLDANDSHAFFEAEGGLLRTGPTGTNVRDLLLASVAPARG
ncbi:MAG: glycerate kinase type-2 family protein [Myxococcota bacterium]